MSPQSAIPRRIYHRIVLKLQRTPAKWRMPAYLAENAEVSPQIWQKSNEAREPLLSNRFYSCSQTLPVALAVLQLALVGAAVRGRSVHALAEGPVQQPAALVRLAPGLHGATFVASYTPLVTDAEDAFYIPPVLETQKT